MDPDDMPGDHEQHGPANSKILAASHTYIEGVTMISSMNEVFSKVQTLCRDGNLSQIPLLTIGCKLNCQSIDASSIAMTN